MSLDLCRCFVLASNPRHGMRIARHMESVGFGECGLFDGHGGLTQSVAEGHDFLFVEDVVASLEMEHVISAIRASEEDRVRFMPIVLLTAQEPAGGAAGFRRLGFDDIVPVRAEPPEMRQRLMQQIGQPRDYYKTLSYFGPDRRTVERSRVGSRCEENWSHALHFVIFRSPDGKVTIEEKNVLTPQQSQTAAAS